MLNEYFDFDEPIDETMAAKALDDIRTISLMLARDCLLERTTTEILDVLCECGDTVADILNTIERIKADPSAIYIFATECMDVKTIDTRGF